MMTSLEESILLIDGATGTLLERKGVDISLPLWSAHAVIEHPEVLEEVHREYLEAGAQAITTCTFRTNRRALAKAGLADRTEELTRKAVEIAQRARDAVNPEALILGSVAPLEDCYRPDLAPDYETCSIEHGMMIEYLLAGGVDVILIETQNCLRESEAAIGQARKQMPAGGKWMVSYCTKREGAPLVTLAGESLTEYLATLDDAWAIGVNCIAAPSTESQVKLLRSVVPSNVRIAAYANIGYADPMGNWIPTDAVDPERYTNYAAQWIADGATIIGGCCGTRPEMIRAIAEHLHSRVG
ncbi:MAG: homocysteine S-methyltransferase family protein [Planctomycetes bacterium]|nr:homocysteine S-methyltransferase family protein [Planctomycetota bacterium]